MRFALRPHSRSRPVDSPRSGWPQGQGKLPRFLALAQASPQKRSSVSTRHLQGAWAHGIKFADCINSYFGRKTRRVLAAPFRRSRGIASELHPRVFQH